MYCSQCGSKIEEGNAYCMTCGTPVKIRPKDEAAKSPFGDGTQEDPFRSEADDFAGEKAPENTYGFETETLPMVTADQNNGTVPGGEPLDEERSFGLYLLLTLLTCGIYGIIFKYKLTEDVNRICEGDGQHTMNYIAVILLSIVTCGIYGYVWLYQIGDRIQQTAGMKYGVTSNVSGVKLLALALAGTVSCGICGCIGDYELINAVNELSAEYNRSGR